MSELQGMCIVLKTMLKDVMGERKGTYRVFVRET
jgi:hypothetical protein